MIYVVELRNYFYKLKRVKTSHDIVKSNFISTTSFSNLCSTMIVSFRAIHSAGGINATAGVTCCFALKEQTRRKQKNTSGLSSLRNCGPYYQNAI